MLQWTEKPTVGGTDLTFYKSDFFYIKYKVSLILTRRKGPNNIKSLKDGGMCKLLCNKLTWCIELLVYEISVNKWLLRIPENQ